MELCKKTVMCISAFLLLAGVMLFAPKSNAADINITFPSERSVFQRNDDNVSDITVKADYSGSDAVKARIVSGETEIAGWKELQSAGSGYEGVIEGVTAGGWYTLEVAAFDASGNEIEKAVVEKLGVGEVFITGGQSNSANFGGEKTTAEYDEVSTLNPSTGKWQPCADSQPCTSDFNTGNGGGSPWPSFGDALYEQIGVPVGIICTGRGSAKISELNGNMFSYIKAGIDAIKPYGCRGFLIHQGEADTPDTDREQYVADYKELIEKTRDEFGYDLNWFIARVSYAWSNYNDKAKQESMVNAQISVCNDYNIFVGPTTDDLLGDYRHTDNLHMSKKGLIEHGKRWADVVFKSIFTGYQLVPENVANGKIDQCGAEQYAGRAVRLSATPDKGYYLVPGSFKVMDGEEEIEVNDNVFIMRAKDLSVTAEFAPLPQHFADLLAKINEALKVDKTQYENVSVEALDKAVAAAQAVYDNPASSETDTAKAKNDLDTAIKGLIIKKAAPPVPTPTQGADNDDKNTVKAGTVKTVGNVKYVVKADRKVSVKAIVNKNRSSVVIPKSIKINGVSYKVTGIEKKAFAGAKKLKKITIKSTTIKTIGKKAFDKINAKVKIKVPANKLKAYKKLIKKSGYKKLSRIIK